MQTIVCPNSNENIIINLISSAPTNIPLLSYCTSDEWNCDFTSNTGRFNRSTNCTITGNNHVDVTNTLEINGTNTDMNNLITITAATNQRHFYLNDAMHQLNL